MILISHRGNLNGKKIDKENSTKVTGFTTRQYFISSKKQADSTSVVNRGDTESAETMIYYGIWIILQLHHM